MFPQDAIDAAELSEKSECQILAFIAYRWRYLLLVVVLELVNASFGIHDYYYLEAHSQRGTVVAKYLENDHNGYKVHEVISYPVTEHGATVHKNCTYHNEFFQHKSRALHELSRIALRTERMVYVPEPGLYDTSSTCVAEDTKGAHFSHAMTHLVFAVFIVAFMCIQCRRAKPAPPTAMAIEMVTNASAVQDVSVEAVQYAPVGQEDTDAV
jgi:hypothetical protein